MTNTPAVNGKPEDEIPQCCGTCLCYVGVNEGGGLCRRNPPQVIIMMVPDLSAGIVRPGERQRVTPQAQGQWPPVPVQGWCYEYVDPRSEGFDPVQLAAGDGESARKDS